MGIEEVSDIIFGIHPVQEALRSGKKFERLYIGRGRKGKAIAEILELAKSQGVDARFEPWKRLTARLQGQLPNSGAGSHQGVIGVLATYSYVAFDDLVAIIGQKKPPFLLLLDQIQDPYNLGAILRTAECVGVHGVIIPKNKAVGITPTVSKVSAGATAYMPVCRVTNMASTIEELKDAGLWIVGTSSKARQHYTEVDLTMPVAIVIGNEEKGIRRLVAQKCDIFVSIPLYGKIAALNASVSAAILMFEVRRQRRIKAPLEKNL